MTFESWIEEGLAEARHDLAQQVADAIFAGARFTNEDLLEILCYADANAKTEIEEFRKEVEEIVFNSVTVTKELAQNQC